MTLILIVVAGLLSLGLGVAAGWWRGPMVGIAAGLGVLLAAGAGYVAVLSLSLPM